MMEESSALLLPPAADDQPLLQALFRAMVPLSGEHDLGRLVQGLVSAVLPVAPEVDCAILWLYHPEDQRIRWAASAVVASIQAPSTEPLLQASLALGEGCIGRSLAAGRPIIMADIAAFERENAEVCEPEREIIGHYVTTIAPWAAVINLPLRLADEPVGVLQLINADGVLPLRVETLPAVELWAGHLALIIRYAQLRATTSLPEQTVQTFGGVITAIVDGVMLCNSDGEIVLVNEAATAMLAGVIQAQTSLGTFTMAYYLRDAAGVPLSTAATPLGRAVRGEVFHDYEIMARTHDGNDIVLSTSGAPMLTAQGAIDGAVVVLRDITTHKAQDAARDQFLAIAAHELRTPLAAIKGYTDLLIRREGNRPDVTERELRGNAMLGRQIDHMVRLVDNLLDMSRLDAGRLQLLIQPHDLMALVDVSADRVRASDGQHVVEVIGPPTCIVACDQLRIQQVLTNLIGNAARYSPPDTTITVEAGIRLCTDEAGAATTPCAVILVRDQGPGIPPEMQAHIFDRYFRASTIAGGLGLGLYLTREIVLLHGGRLGVDSTPGAGATFWVELPLSDQ